MLKIVVIEKGTNRQIVNLPSDDAVEAIKTARKFYKARNVKQAGVFHQTGIPVFYRTKIRARRKSWIG